MKAVTQQALERVEELVNLAKAARESSETLAQDRATYASKFAEAVSQLDEYLTRKEIAEVFEMSEGALNVLIHRQKKKDKEA